MLRYDRHFSLHQIKLPHAPCLSCAYISFASPLYTLPHLMAATIQVVEGRKLIGKNPNGFSNPYVLIGPADPQTGLFANPGACNRSEVFSLITRRLVQILTLFYDF